MVCHCVAGKAAAVAPPSSASTGLIQQHCQPLRLQRQNRGLTTQKFQYHKQQCAKLKLGLDIIIVNIKLMNVLDDPLIPALLCCAASKSCCEAGGRK